MTVGELIAELQRFDPKLAVRYEYDSGHDYPTFKEAHLETESDRYPVPFVCLIEAEPDWGD